MSNLDFSWVSCAHDADGPGRCLGVALSKLTGQEIVLPEWVIVDDFFKIADQLNIYFYSSCSVDVPGFTPLVILYPTRSESIGHAEYIVDIGLWLHCNPKLTVCGIFSLEPLEET